MSKTIAFVPARGGSKSIPGKNIKDIAGKPLIWWSLQALNASNSINQIVVATDSDEIESTVTSFQFDKVSIYRRDSQNAQDHSTTESVMFEYLKKNPLEAEDLFLLVQATSPLTTSTDFDQAITQFTKEGLDSMLSAVRLRRFLWSDDAKSLNYSPEDRPRRQDFKGSLMENGAFYISKVGPLLENQNRLHGKIGIYELPESHSVEADEIHDWVQLEALLKGDK